MTYVLLGNRLYFDPAIAMFVEMVPSARHTQNNVWSAALHGNCYDYVAFFNVRH
jgi:hypothetical protein